MCGYTEVEGSQGRQIAGPFFGGLQDLPYDAIPINHLIETEKGGPVPSDFIGPDKPNPIMVCSRLCDGILNFMEALATKRDLSDVPVKELNCLINIASLLATIKVSETLVLSTQAPCPLAIAMQENLTIDELKLRLNQRPKGKYE